MRSTQSNTIITVNNPIKKPITLNLISNRVFDYISKAARFKRSSAHQSAVHIRLAHQLPGVGRFDAATILNPDTPGNRLVEGGGQDLANERVSFLGLRGRGCFAGANRPNR